MDVDVDLVVPEREAVPLGFVDSDECLRLLLRQMWTFPDAGGTRRSWAVKESSVLKGDLMKAFDRPGLGIALFTTELAREVFGENANQKIQACIDWGVTQAAEKSLLAEKTESGITGRVTTSLDLRHSVALAILMARLGVHKSHVEQYLKLVLESTCIDGGWPEEFGSKKSELPSTVYVVEFLSVLARSPTAITHDVSKYLRCGQQWLISATKPEGGWATEIFADKAWDTLWSTAYLLQRLFAAESPKFSDWSQALVEATKSIMRSAAKLEYEDKETQFRVEARVAAALAWSLRINLPEALLQERIESWLNEWQRRFLHYLRTLPSRVCDLATATFAARALLRTYDYRDVGDQVLAEIS